MCKNLPTTGTVNKRIHEKLTGGGISNVALYLRVFFKKGFLVI